MENYDEIMLKLKRKLRGQWINYPEKSYAGKIFLSIEKRNEFEDYLERLNTLIDDDGNDMPRVDFEELSAFAKGANIAHIDCHWLKFRLLDDAYHPKVLPMLSGIDSQKKQIDYFKGLALLYRRLFFEKLQKENRIRRKLHQMRHEILAISKQKGFTDIKKNNPQSDIGRKMKTLLVDLSDEINMQDIAYVSIPDFLRMAEIFPSENKKYWSIKKGIAAGLAGKDSLQRVEKSTKYYLARDFLNAVMQYKDHSGFFNSRREIKSFIAACQKTKEEITQFWEKSRKRIEKNKK